MLNESGLYFFELFEVRGGVCGAGYVTEVTLTRECDKVGVRLCGAPGHRVGIQVLVLK